MTKEIFRGDSFLEIQINLYENFLIKNRICLLREEALTGQNKTSFIAPQKIENQDMLNSPTVTAKVKSFKMRNPNYSDKDLRLYLQNLKRRKNLVSDINKTITSTKEHSYSKRPMTVKSLLMSKHLSKLKELRNKSEGRKLQKHAAMEQNWEKFTSFIKSRIQRPKTGISLMNSSDNYKQYKFQKEFTETQDPNPTQYGRSVWLSSLRSNEEVDKWPYNLSIKKYKRAKTKITKRQNYPDFIHSYRGTHYAYTMLPMRKHREEVVRNSDIFFSQKMGSSLYKTQDFSNNKTIEQVTAPVTAKLNTLVSDQESSKVAQTFDISS
ncbi:unnamed protein product [Moneuplotes crassus]|uniref:Uncharacterized protein n=1 Tax=Euplotes crassus TaxID=5936 RepID=A0AAD1UIT0_EUPCR|nr:unnamed protein product [Moneuplotes crassus]